MRVLTSVCLIAFAIGLGITVAYRMHTEAMAVVVGVLCGVSASIPVSLLVLYAARQSQRTGALAPTPPPSPTPPPQPPFQPQPPQIIVVAPGMPNGQSGHWSYPAGLPAPTGQLQPPRAPRDFTIIGDDD